MTTVPSVQWVTHPRHLPEAGDTAAVVVDVAFAAGKSQFKKKTKAFIDGLGEHLLAWIDHHEHPHAWPQYADDIRFTLVPNDIAHACPELITPELVSSDEQRGDVGCIYAHADFDGAMSAIKWILRGKEPWEGADEDARYVDSPGRGHSITPQGLRYARALDEVAAGGSRERRCEFLTELVDMITKGKETTAQQEEIDELSASAAEAEEEAKVVAAEQGREERQGVYVIRVRAPVDGRTRRNLLVEAENRAPIGAIYEPDKDGGHWLTAATFDTRLDLSNVDGFEGGRTDFRFARASKEGKDQLDALADYIIDFL